ncbi:hypothetical protein Tco_0195693 [Tanacetum coccineum]
MSYHVLQENPRDRVAMIGGEVMEYQIGHQVVYLGKKRALGDEFTTLGDGVFVLSWVKSTNNCFGGMMLILALGDLEMEALVEAMNEKFRHRIHHHHVDEMTCRDDEKMRMRRNDVPCHDHFEMRIYLPDCNVKTSQDHTVIWEDERVGFALGTFRFVLTRTLASASCRVASSSLFGEDLIWSKSNGLTFNGTVYHDTFQFKKSTNIVRSRKVGGIWTQITEDDKIAIFIGLNRDLTIEIKNESWNNRFVDFKETIEANVCEETLDVVGFVVGLINNTSFGMLRFSIDL